MDYNIYMTLKETTFLFPLIVSALFLSGCTKKNSQQVAFSDDELQADSVTPYQDNLADAKISIGQTQALGKEFQVNYQTKDPSGEGTAKFQAKSVKTIDKAGEAEPEQAKKLVLVEIAVMGNETNKGSPSNFNQVGANPSPQFVLIDKNKNKTWVEETYYSDAYTQSKDLFELSKITMDHQKWIHTALVFQIDQVQEVDLAFRFLNPQGQLEFYDIQE